MEQKDLIQKLQRRADATHCSGSECQLIQRIGAPQRYLDGALCVLFPPLCTSCREPLNQRPEYGLCLSCEGTLEPNNAPTPKSLLNELDGFVAPHLYGGALADLIGHLKFNGERSVATHLARLIHSSCPGVFTSPRTHIVPVPLSRARLRERGFNQSTLIARQISKRSPLTLSHCLKRTRNTPPQAQLDKRTRRINVADAFATTGARVPKHLVLIDDVVTTGATMQSAARTLRAHGAKTIWGIAASLTA